MLAVHKNGNGSLVSLLAGRYSPYFLSGTSGMVLSIGYLIARHRKSRGPERRQFWLTVAMNAVTVVLLAIIGEAAVRVLALPAPRGLQLFGTQLIPYSWDRVAAHYRNILRTNPNHISYFIADDLLGWTVGPARRSNDGLYASSSEGIRSAHPGVSYTHRAPSHRIALVGDSFTFGLEVPFEDTWGAHLERALGPQVQVLNFGVDGYGVDQAYLRYQRDVRPWRPDLVILGIINHDLYRSLAVYSFLSFPDWGFPFAKPRFIANPDKLLLVNTPLPAPEVIFANRSITDLPYLQYEPGYHADDWQWRPLHQFFLARFLLSRFPRAYDFDADATDETLISMNREILLAFIKLARIEGSTPLIVYFPSRGDFKGEQFRLEKRWEKDRVLAELRARQIEYTDLTACLSRLSPTELFLEGRPHYSAAGNRAVVECLLPVVIDKLKHRAPAESARGPRLSGGAFLGSPLHR